MSGHLYAWAGNVVLIIETSAPEPGVMLYTFMPDGFVGDNWLPDIGIAMEQAARNVSGFPGRIRAWKPVPKDTPDLMEFGKALVKNSI